MKKQIAGLFGFALLLAAASAHAQITETVQVKVPFSFVAAGKTWPAADYKVQITQPTGLIKLSADNIAPANHDVQHEPASRKGRRQVIHAVRALRR